MATFAGLPLGFASTLADVPNPIRYQIKRYPGVDGRARTRMGSDGGRVVALCHVGGSSSADLLAWEAAVYQYQHSGEKNPLVDNIGTFYESAFLATIEPMGPVISTDFDGGVVRTYRLTFEYD